MNSGDDILSLQHDSRVSQFRGWVLIAVPLGVLVFPEFTSRSFGSR